MKTKILYLVTITIALAFFISCSDDPVSSGEKDKPTVSILSPLNNAEYEEGLVINIKAMAEDSSGIQIGWLYMDGVPIDTVDQFPLNYAWQTTGNSGPHNLKVTAVDQNGNSGDSEIISINIVNNKPVILEMVAVSGDTFIMGDTWGDGNGNEIPTHPVLLSSFRMGAYEVTNRQAIDIFNWALAYGKITANSLNVLNVGSDPQTLLKLSGDDNIFLSKIEYDGTHLIIDHAIENHPVVGLSWYGALALCNYLSEKENLEACYDLNTWSCDFLKNGYRLPTEAEWEYTARGGSLSQGYKYSGSDSALLVAWVNDNSQGTTHEIGQKPVNELAIYDMSGNVHEWCWDWEGNYPETLQINPTGSEIDNRRITRGGSWIAFIESARVANRDPQRPDRNLFYLGLRVTRNE